MQEYLFSKQELNLIKFLKTETPFRIWSDPIEYIFEYVDFYIALQIKCVKSFNLGYIIEGNKNSFKDSQLTQYVLKAKLEKVNNKYISQQASKQLSANEKVNEISVVRTLLYFCKYRRIKENPTYYEGDSYISNPDFELDEKLKIEKKFLADIGIVVHLNNRNLNCFIMENDDDFSTN
ncbi:MAG TPA: hypothetical protein DCS66_15065 [Flavobacteriaceae bacterium]|nr:hypothetical protein [Flavobacteriaceae bacterium]HAT65891.1 hypothetical protein [Flavobacteriaceae bacterium]|tara:strand:+ start:96 stop:629 length:534 start_codon:yes stop_codon:yes gene_type:complete